MRTESADQLRADIRALEKEIETYKNPSVTSAADDQYNQMSAKLAELDSRITALEQKAYEQSVYSSATSFPQIIGGLGDAVKEKYIK